MLNHALLFALLALAQIEVQAQNVQVNLQITEFSTRIEKYTREQMEKQIIDSVVSSCNREFEKFTNSFSFYQKNDSLNLPADYILELRIADTTIFNEKYKEVSFVNINTKIYEAETPNDSIWQAMESMAISYGLDPAAVEHDAITKYVNWSVVQATLVVRKYLPLSLDRVIPSNNVSTDWTSLLDYSKDVIVRINAKAISSQDFRADQKKVGTLIQNCFLLSQEFYYRATRKKKANFNYYLSTDSIPLHVEANSPMRIEFAIDTTLSGYSMRLQSVDSNIMLDSSECYIQFDKDILDKRPTLVNSKICGSISSFVYKNL